MTKKLDKTFVGCFGFDLMAETKKSRGNFVLRNEIHNYWYKSLCFRPFLKVQFTIEINIIFYVINWLSQNLTNHPEKHMH